MFVSPSHKLIVFGDFSDVRVDTSEQKNNYINLSNEFIKKNLLTGVKQDIIFEFDPRKNEPPVQKMIMRPNIVSSDNKWIVNFSANRIDIILNSKKEDGFVDEEDFIKKANKYLNIIKNSYSLKLNRIAVNIEDVLTDFSEEEANKILKKVMNTNISLYKDKSLKEWSLQCGVVETFSNEEKSVNIITSIQRGSRNFFWNPNKYVDSITVLYDINTVVLKDNSEVLSDNVIESFVKSYKDKILFIKNDIFGEQNE